MSNQIYKAWTEEALDFSSNLSLEQEQKFILRLASLAPSTFNCQPWKCQIKEKQINIFIDLANIPRQSDKQARFAYISVGCFIQSARIVAEAIGWKTSLELFTTDNGDGLNKVATLKFIGKIAGKTDTEELRLLQQRATNRSLYLDKDIEGLTLQQAAQTCQNGISLRTFNKDKQSDLLSISWDADLKIWSDIKFRREHVQWVRHNLTRRSDGMPGFGVGVKLIPSFFAKPIILSPLFAKIQARKNQQSLSSTKRFGVLLSPDNHNAWLNIGISFMNISLLFARHEAVVAPMGQFIESEEARHRLASICASNLLPQLFFRIGYPSKPVHHSPRRSVEDFLVV